jgi:hypothetical protein
VRPYIWGFQIRRGTLSNRGLSEEELARHEIDIGFRFPSELPAFLEKMNGTDAPALEVKSTVWRRRSTRTQET